MTEEEASACAIEEDIVASVAEVKQRVKDIRFMYIRYTSAQLFVHVCLFECVWACLSMYMCTHTHKHTHTHVLIHIAVCPSSLLCADDSKNARIWRWIHLKVLACACVFSDKGGCH